MRTLEINRPTDDVVVDARGLFRQDDELLADFRRRMEFALETLRAHEQAARQQEGF